MNVWNVSEDTLDTNIKKIHSQESVFTIGNGYFCTRGTFEEGYPRDETATLLFGVFDRVPIAKEELANVPDWAVIRLFVNNERFRLDRGTILEYQRTLDIQHGVLSRSVHWQSPGGIRIRVTTQRFASMGDAHVGAIRYSVTLEETPGHKPVDIAIRGSLNMAEGNYNFLHWEPVDQGHTEELLWLQTETKDAQVQLAQSISFTIDAPSFRREFNNSDIAPSIHYYGQLASGETLAAEKLVVMYTSRDGEGDIVRAALEHHMSLFDQTDTSPGEIDLQSENTPASTKPQLGVYDRLLGPHYEGWQQFWQVADVIVEGDTQAQLALRYNLYQLRISVSAHDNRYSIAAKGLTGFGYRGHIFHDTEIFMLPFFSYVLPDIARNLLIYRHRLLPAARKKAASNGYEGAQYPWESTLSGEEVTPPSIIHPETGEVIPVLNGFIELHITSSIAYAVWQYWSITDDRDFMRDYGAEIILSTAMFWVSRAEKRAEGNVFEFSNVIGPDEWHEHINNNAHTNTMARRNIETALQALRWLQTSEPEKARELTQQLHLTSDRLEYWQTVKDGIYIPQNQETGLIEQFDGFFKLAHFDQEQYKGRKDSYQAILGMEGVQKYQIVKQADVLMMLTLLKQEVDLKTKQVNWDYYYPITDHKYGSSLTPALHAILASELGYVDDAYELFMLGALVDLNNTRNNTPEGIHCACSGAVWQAVILGIAGLQVTDDGYTTNPHWPKGWTRLAFSFRHKGELISVDLHP